MGAPTKRLMERGAVVALLAAMLAGAVVLSLFNAAPANAATVTARVSAQMAQESGYDGDQGAANPSSGDCIRYGQAPLSTDSGIAPNTGGDNGTPDAAFTDGETAWVDGNDSSDTVYSAHGRSDCEPAASGGVNLGAQSAIGFQPTNVTSFESGVIFNLGTMVHRNNAINATNTWYQGNMNIRLSFGANQQEMSYRWQLHETPNSSNSPSDVLTFLNTVGDAEVVGDDGLTYTIVVHGFTRPQANNSCAATVPSLGAVEDEFITTEGASTFGCLYASFQQSRSLTVVKAVESAGGSAPATDFEFTASSSVAGSNWDGTFTLADGESNTATYTSSEEIRIEESPVDSWNLQDVSCVDADGDAVAVDVSGGVLTIPADLPVSSVYDADVTCTFTNSYEPDTTSTLTLQNTVDTTGQPSPTASSYNWTLAADGPTDFSGRGQAGQDDATPNPAITGQTVDPGTYTLSQAPEGPLTIGYEQVGEWSCVDADGQTLAVTNGNQVDIPAGVDATCTVNNAYQTGTLEITETITTSPSGGFTGDENTSFEVRYECTPGDISGTVTVNAGAQEGQPGAPVSVPNLPSGVSCTVAEVSPLTGSSTHLQDSTWQWNAPTNPAAVTIPANGEVRVNIDNQALRTPLGTPSPSSPPPATPSVPGTPTPSVTPQSATPPLVNTGAELPMVAALGAIGLVLAGGLLLWMRKRRHAKD
ncbi:MAG: choice-of-anchor K domain-containing protein [Beutenbergiaceae bacterium]